MMTFFPKEVSKYTMKINQKKYIPLIWPIDKPSKELNKKEAELFFNWFINQIDGRSDYLRQIVSKQMNVPMSSLDYSFDSLTIVWKWFLQIAVISKTPKSILNIIENELTKASHPPDFIDLVVSESKSELSVITQYVIRDIGMYVGKVFITNHSTLRWEYHTSKKDSKTNVPQIFGFVNNDYDPPFELEFDPIHFTEMQASKLLDKSQNEKDLYNICVRWSQWIPNRKYYTLGS